MCALTPLILMTSPTLLPPPTLTLPLYTAPPTMDDSMCNSMLSLCMKRKSRDERHFPISQGQPKELDLGERLAAAYRKYLLKEYTVPIK